MSTSAEIMREKEKHLQLYRDIVDVFENMDDDDDEAKKEIDANKVKVLMNQISAISGLLPAEVQAAQVSLWNQNHRSYVDLMVFTRIAGTS